MPWLKIESYSYENPLGILIAITFHLQLLPAIPFLPTMVDRDIIPIDHGR